jgi:hypothetical protein
MEQVDLRRYEATDILGTGADYEVRAAVERDTGRSVVLKRPHPQAVRHRLHDGIEARTELMLTAYREMGHAIPTLVPIIGYSARANHDAYFGDAVGQEYRVIVQERAHGIPLVGDPMARLTGVPIGIGQNLFALFPLLQPDSAPSFALHRQILDLEEAFLRAGYVLLDLRPQNVFYQPASGRIGAIDYGALIGKNGDLDRRRRRPRDIHDFYLEILKFYITPQQPPAQASGYREPYGLRPVVSFEDELDHLAQQFRQVQDDVRRDCALSMIGRLRQRAYAGMSDFRRDLLAYLEAMRRSHQSLPNLAAVHQAWAEALNGLRADYWRRYLFDPESELAGLMR